MWTLFSVTCTQRHQLGWKGMNIRLGIPLGSGCFILLCLRFQICKRGWGGGGMWEGDPFLKKLLYYMRTCMRGLTTWNLGWYWVRFWGAEIVLVMFKSKTTKKGKFYAMVHQWINGYTNYGIPYNAILLSHKVEWSADMLQHYVRKHTKWKKPDTKGHFI